MDGKEAERCAHPAQERKQDVCHRGIAFNRLRRNIRSGRDQVQRLVSAFLSDLAERAGIHQSVLNQEWQLG